MEECLRVRKVEQHRKMVAGDAEVNSIEREWKKLKRAILKKGGREYRGEQCWKGVARGPELSSIESGW